jgi:hypothetical protein
VPNPIGATGFDGGYISTATRAAPSRNVLYNLTLYDCIPLSRQSCPMSEKP